MNVLLIGSGGREHAMAWKLAQSSLLDELYIAPGNPGTVRHGHNVELDMDDPDAVRELILRERIEMVVIGPEAPLVGGLPDRIHADPALRDKVTVIGPGKLGARLEGSKEFAKEFMVRHSIPTAAYRAFGREQIDEAIAHLDHMDAPYVIKADGLAQGKGVVVATDREQAVQALKEMLGGNKLGAAADRVLIEQHLAGIEVSAFMVTDGVSFKMLPTAKDYKRIGDDDTGPNTGGMGAVSPVPFANDAFMAKVHDRIAVPTVRGLQNEGIRYRGFLYLGLMNVNGEPYLLEYNVRLGDPEAQAILPRLRSDLMDLFEGIATNTLSERHIDMDDRTCITVVLASEGYPGHYETGRPIVGLDLVQDAHVFHSGTALRGDELVTNGGRVLGITAFGKTLEHAMLNVYKNAALIDFKGRTLRMDIGHDLLGPGSGKGNAAGKAQAIAK